MTPKEAELELYREIINAMNNALKNGLSKDNCYLSAIMDCNINQLLFDASQWMDDEIVKGLCRDELAKRHRELAKRQGILQ